MKEREREENIILFQEIIISFITIYAYIKSILHMDYKFLSSLVLEALKQRFRNWDKGCVLLGPDANFWLVIIYLFPF